MYDLSHFPLYAKYQALNMPFAFHQFRLVQFVNHIIFSCIFFVGGYAIYQEQNRS